MNPLAILQDKIQRKLVFFALFLLPIIANAEEIRVSSLNELDEFSSQSGNIITMKPGIYRLGDYLPPESMKERRERNEFQFMTFSGDDNTFHLNGVTIELDTALRTALKPPIHTSEFIISGDNNTFNGLTITTHGNETSPGGALLEVAGEGNTLRDCVFWVQGSYPYGYGDLFGKGGGSVIRHSKHSGVRITGESSSLFGCRLFMRSYGHGFYIQGGDNHTFTDCYVEGVMRSTDDMLAEITGPAHEVDFRSVYTNRQGGNQVLPGYMKSLSEDGFRTYTQAGNVRFINCTAKYMRAGFELRTRGGVYLENCTAIGTERGFWVSNGAVLKNCKGDARFGPLLFVEGENANVEIELAPTESEMNVHALATIHGSGHSVTIKPYKGENRSRSLPILVGFSQPSAGEGMSPYGEKKARDITLRNETTMPVVIGELVENFKLTTRGPVQSNQGQEILIREIK